jgi:demethylmenaquinone methyltransferase / 2-methoxy-6-polyprenyl-1,4-benzoquinol methylase
MAVVPYKNSDSGKKEQVAEMFNNISHRYDFLNRFLSAGVDIGWRKAALAELAESKPALILDVATGTGDFALMSYKILKPEQITGVDISEGMLNVGRKKVAEAGLTDKISLHLGDSENLQFPDHSFDALTVAFGVRNFENLEKGLKEFHRVLKPGGKLLILEFSKPQTPFRYLFNFYFKYILPVVGRLVSRDMSAYSYLPESVKHFPSGEAFITKLKEAGFKDTKWKQLTFGISSIYTGVK